ncbi:MAG: hypothetical protein ACREJB_09245, partial [Planctomycetaceae bacterium]
MLRCPFCEADLSSLPLHSGRCPACGGVVSWDMADEEPAAVASGPVRSGSEKGAAEDPSQNASTAPAPSTREIFATFVGRSLLPTQPPPTEFTSLPRATDEIEGSPHDTVPVPPKSLPAAEAPRDTWRDEPPQDAGKQDAGKTVVNRSAGDLEPDEEMMR